MVIHVRPITNEEGNKLANIVRHGKDPIELKRAQVVLSSAQGFTPPKIGTIVLMTPGYVRTLIHSFNLHGFKMLKPDWKLGGNRKFTDEEDEVKSSNMRAGGRGEECGFLDCVPKPSPSQSS